MSMFDPSTFLQTTVEGALSTKYPTLPDGMECNGVIDDVDANGGYSEKMNDGKGGHWASLKVVWKLDSPEAEEILGRSEPTVKQDIFLDLDSEGRLDLSEGRNVALGRLREAVGQNLPGQSWSIPMLVGAAAHLQIGTEEDNRDADKPPSERRVYNKVVAVTHI